MAISPGTLSIDRLRVMGAMTTRLRSSMRPSWHGENRISFDIEPSMYRLTLRNLIAQPNVRYGLRSLACSSYPRVGLWSRWCLDCFAEASSSATVYRHAPLLQFAKPFANCHPKAKRIPSDARHGSYEHLP